MLLHTSQIINLDKPFIQEVIDNQQQWIIKDLLLELMGRIKLSLKQMITILRTKMAQFTLLRLLSIMDLDGMHLDVFLKMFLLLEKQHHLSSLQLMTFKQLVGASIILLQVWLQHQQVLW